MKDVYSRAVFGLVAIIIIFMFPIIFIGLQMQRTAETRANEYTEAFVDNCRASAFFTDYEYEKYLTEMGLLGVTWDIDFYHYSTVNYPDGEGGFVTSELVNNREDIEGVLYSDLTQDITKYEMKKGDRIEIIATSTSEFAGVGFLHIFDKGKPTKIYIQCGEQIDNYTD